MNSEEKIIELLTEIRDSLKKPEPKKRIAFVPPTHNDLFQYCQLNDFKLKPQAFIDFYESKNWMVGKTKMKDWKAAARNWERRNNGQKTTTSRAKTHHDKLREIAKSAIDETGHF